MLLTLSYFRVVEVGWKAFLVNFQVPIDIIAFTLPKHKGCKSFVHVRLLNLGDVCCLLCCPGRSEQKSGEDGF